jgi:chromosome segregation ATPase
MDGHVMMNGSAHSSHMLVEEPQGFVQESHASKPEETSTRSAKSSQEEPSGSPAPQSDVEVPVVSNAALVDQIDALKLAIQAVTKSESNSIPELVDSLKKFRQGHWHLKTIHKKIQDKNATLLEENKRLLKKTPPDRAALEETRRKLQETESKLAESRADFENYKRATQIRIDAMLAEKLELAGQEKGSQREREEMRNAIAQAQQHLHNQQMQITTLCQQRDDLIRAIGRLS